MSIDQSVHMICHSELKVTCLPGAKRLWGRNAQRRTDKRAKRPRKSDI